MKFATKILSLSTITLSIFAEMHDQNTIANTSHTPMDPNPSARWGTHRAGNFFIQGEVLWIKPLGLDFKDTPGFFSSSTTYRYFQNNFTTGERVSVGYNTSYDGWDAVLEYTGFNYHHNNSGVISGLLSNLTTTTKHAIYFNQGDLDFGRMMQVSRKLKMRPHVGARVLWLSQRSTISDVDGFNSDKLKNTLGGLELGVDSVWMFAKEFGVYANLGVTTLVNQAKNIVTNSSPSRQATSYGSKVVNGYDVKVGIRWDRNFSNDNYHFGINFGYEQHNIINLNAKVPSFFADSSGFVDPDFTWQAIALGGRFDF